jgi:hypothetical protein
MGRDGKGLGIGNAVDAALNIERQMLLLLFRAIVSSAQVGCASPSASPITAGDERAIIAAAIDSLYAKTMTMPGGTVAIEATTKTILPSAVEEIRSSMPLLDVKSSEVVGDFMQRNAVSCDLRELLRDSPLASRVVFLTADSLARFGEGGPIAYWRALEDRYPASGGLVTVSRPGVNPSGSRAILYIGRGCGVRCGAWGYASLRKENGRWKIERYVIRVRS